MKMPQEMTDTRLKSPLLPSEGLLPADELRLVSEFELFLLKFSREDGLFF